jgi:hypothetical protein
MDLTALINECACTKVRTAARAVTRLYDDALRPVGLRGTQLSVLVAVASAEAVNIASLSRMLGQALSAGVKDSTNGMLRKVIGGNADRAWTAEEPQLGIA